MYRFISRFVIAMTTVSCSTAAEPAIRLVFAPRVKDEARAQVRWIQARRLDEKLTIDGVLLDPAWLRASTSSRFVRATSGLDAPGHTRMMVGHDREHLYLAITTDESPRKGERFEMLFDTLHGHESCHVLSVSAAGDTQSWTTTEGERARWEPVFRSRVGRSQEGWTLELALARRSLADASNDIVGFNVVRTGRDLVTWNPSGPEARLPAGLGHLVFETQPVTVQAVRAGTFVRGGNLLRLHVGNRSLMPLQTRAVLTVEPAGAKSYRRYYEFKLAAGKVGVAPLRYLLTHKGTANLEVALLDDALKRRFFCFRRRNVTPVEAIRVRRLQTEQKAFSAEVSLAFRPDELDALELVVSLRRAGSGTTLASVKRRKPTSSRFHLYAEGDFSPGLHELRVSVVRNRLLVSSVKTGFEAGAKEQ